MITILYSSCCLLIIWILRDGVFVTSVLHTTSSSVDPLSWTLLMKSDKKSQRATSWILCFFIRVFLYYRKDVLLHSIEVDPWGKIYWNRTLTVVSMKRLDLSVMCQNQNKESWDIEAYWLKWINNIIFIVRSLPKYIILNLCYPLYLRWDSSITIHLGTNQLGCNEFTPKETKNFFGVCHFSLIVFTFLWSFPLSRVLSLGIIGPLLCCGITNKHDTRDT